MAWRRPSSFWACKVVAARAANEEEAKRNILI